MQLLGGLTTQQFLHEYWQKKPLLIRQAIPGFSSPLQAEELAGMACEEEVESRIILERDGPSPWHLETGPFAEDRFSQLPSSHWTLLVQKANQHIPELAEFLDSFNFIPSWRIDDIMISYAPVEGSVGPHVDQYDVFLLQGQGQRRWQISTADSQQTARVENTALDILADFEAENEWLLEPGDMLYLPPNVAHYGVALNDCITYSIGFRAPSQSELITAWSDELAAQPGTHKRYSDPELALQTHPGEIEKAALDKIITLLTANLKNTESIQHWFGRYITEPPAHQADMQPDELLTDNEIISRLDQYGMFFKSEFSRFSFIRFPNEVGFYVDGIEMRLSKNLLDFVALLCDQRSITREQLTPFLTETTVLDTLTRLYNLGAIWFGEDDEF